MKNQTLLTFRIEGIDTSETENESSSNEAESDEEADEDESSDDDVIQQGWKFTHCIWHTELAEIDFGTLAKAQKSLSVPSSSTSKHTKPPSRLKPDRQPKSPIEPNPKSKSKNAPQELSSKKPVSRKHFLHLPTSQLHKPRDPRFDTLNNTVSEPSFRNAYSFLDKYQRDEINVLKEQIRNERDSEQREKLKKTLQSLQSRREGRVSKERAEEVLRQRKKEERDKVAMGKKPFYLKKSIHFLDWLWLMF